jgi:hypothetical protein
MMVRDIEDDLRDFTRSTDATLKGFYEDANRYLPTDAQSTNVRATIPESGRGKQNFVRPAKEEVVKLSHEIEDESRTSAAKVLMAQNLNTQFNLLADQIKDYQKLNILANNKLKASETKVAELETKLEQMEDEVNDLRANGGGGNSSLLLPGAYTTGRVNRPHALNREMNKRTEQMRKALLSGENDEEVAAISIKDMNSKNFYKSLKAYALQYLPFKRDLRTVQARFGTSVASYFIFQRMVFLKMAFVGTIMVMFAIYHLSLYFKNSGGTLSGYIQGDGYLPKFMEYSSFVNKERFTYSAVVVLTMVFITVLLCNQIVAEHKNAITLEALEAENRAPFSKEVLCSWDFAAHSKIDISDLQGKNDHSFLQLLEDSHETGHKQARSNYESFVLYVRRTVGMLLYLAVVSGSFTAIIYLTIYASKISATAKDIPGVNNMGALIGPLALQAINAIVPPLLELITQLEQWDSAQTELKFLLFRVYMSNTLNTLILTLSYILLMDPLLLAEYPTLRRSLELKDSGVFSCRVDQAADGLFTLVGSTWAIQMASFIGSPMSMRVLAYATGKPWVKTEFNIADAMVKKFSFLGLVFVAFPFAPLAMAFVPVYLFLAFKWEKYVIKRYYAKPKRPFKGQKAALLYAVFYLLTYILVGITVSGYFLTTKSMAKDCDIQDEYVHLCSDAVAGDTCHADSGSKYYSFWGKDGDYPKVICENKCGPFVQERSALSAFKDSITGERS